MPDDVPEPSVEQMARNLLTQAGRDGLIPWMASGDEQSLTAGQVVGVANLLTGYLRAAAESRVAALAAGRAGAAWTGTPPTEAGWYWWRYPGFRRRIVEVTEWPGGGLAVHLPERSIHRDGVTTPDKAAGFWAGPILPPPEPQS